ncbi:MAG: division/cell wall cluster transcriptional repressor MraZ [Deltaproteobacteria bacterium]|nr:division/cell wall cluster transcriptional repressor MraZ [Deltaproteobacteria bacterium]
MFRGRYEHSIDSKGRVSIPVKFREELSERYDSRLVMTTFDGCLLAYPHAEWKVLEEKISALPEFRRETRALLRFFYSSAADCPIDKVGRVLIPQSLRDYAKLEKEIVLIGALKRFEIWSRPAWDAAEAGVSVDDIGNMLEGLGL